MNNYGFNDYQTTENKPKNSLFKIICILLLLIAIFIATFIVIKKFETSEVKKIVVTEQKIDLQEGQSYIIKPDSSKGNETNVTYKSYNTEVVEVNETTGRITAKKEGTTTIIIMSKDDSSNYIFIDINVKGKKAEEKEDQKEEQKQEEQKQQEQKQQEQKQEEQKQQEQKQQEQKQQEKKQQEQKQEEPKPATPTLVSVNGIKLAKSSTTVYVGKKEKLEYTISPANATNKNVTWKSSDTKVVSVDQSGNIKGLSEGTATVTVTTKDGNKSSSVKVTVKKYVKLTSISLKSGIYKISIGEKIAVKGAVKFTPSNSSDKTLTWKSGDSKILSVDSKGNITGLKAGETFVSVESPSLKNQILRINVKVLSDKGDIVFGEPHIEKGTNIGVSACGGFFCGIGRYSCQVGDKFGVVLTANGTKYKGNTIEGATVASYKTDNKEVATIHKHPTEAVTCINCTYVQIVCKKEGTATLTIKNSFGGSTTAKVTVTKKK